MWYTSFLFLNSRIFDETFIISLSTSEFFLTKEKRHVIFVQPPNLHKTFPVGETFPSFIYIMWFNVNDNWTEGPMLPLFIFVHLFWLSRNSVLDSTTGEPRDEDLVLFVSPHKYTKWIRTCSFIYPILYLFSSPKEKIEPRITHLIRVQ